MAVSSKGLFWILLRVDLTMDPQVYYITNYFREFQRFESMCDTSNMLLSLYHLVCILKDVKAIQKS